ncbi:MAG: tetratricopeptide repeat protein [Nodularia sp. CChRGM 3473]
MTYFWRLFLSVLIAFCLTFATSISQSLALDITQITANEYLKLGVKQMERSDYQEAIENFNQALQVQEDFAVADSDRCLQLPDYHQASRLRRSFTNADCTQAKNLVRKKFETYLLRGLAYYRQGDDPAAIADYNQAIALKPDDFRVYYNRGLAHAGQENYSQAIVDYNLALTQIPQTASVFLGDIYNDRGLAHLVLQDFPAAMLDFNLAIRFNPQGYRAYFNRGCASGTNGDNFGAVRDFSQVIKLDPSNAQAYVNRGMAQYRLGYHQGAIADLKQASEYFGNQGKTVAYKKTLNLLKSLRQQLEFVTAIA